jgi:tRNA A-37 threonylcarbamoyl transferase component Bud32
VVAYQNNYGIDPQSHALYLERIYERTLKEKSTLPDEPTLLQIKQHLLETIGIIHECGWCHGDMDFSNIFVSGLLFDFSHAHTKTKLSAEAWERYQNQDRRDIEDCYRRAVRFKVRCKPHIPSSCANVLPRN